jgi:hypothetical protein
LNGWGENNTFEIFDKLDHVKQIHGHGGKTRIVFLGDVVRV